MQRSLLFASTILLVFVGVTACARIQAPPRPTVVRNPAPLTNPTVVQKPSPLIDPNVAADPTPPINPTVAQAPALSTNPTASQLVAPPTNPTVAQAPLPPTNPTFAQAPAPLINPTGAQPDLPPGATNDRVLDALDQTGKSLKDFTAKVALTEGDFDLGDVKTSMGQIWFQKKNEDDGRIRVLFDKRKVGALFHKEKVEYLLDNGLLIDRNYIKNLEDRRQVIKPGEKINLLKLGEGPFPLPIGQKKEDVYAQFDVTRLSPAKDDDKELAGTIHLQLKPKPGTRFAKRFAAIDIWVSRTSKFPVQITTTSPNDERKVTKLTDVQINSAGGLKDSDFTLPPIDEKTWGIHTEKFAE